MDRAEAATLVHRAVWVQDSGYLTVAAVTGINVGRLQALRDRAADITDGEIRKLRAFTAERTVRS